MSVSKLRFSKPRFHALLYLSFLSPLLLLFYLSSYFLPNFSPSFSSIPPNSLILYPHPPSIPPSIPSFNSRFLLRTPSICLHPAEGPVLSVHLPTPPLFLTSPFPTFSTLNATTLLPQTLFSSLCFFGNNSHLNTPTCPEILFSPPTLRQPVQTFPHTPVILVPRLPYQANIYHFLTFAATLEHTISLMKSNNEVIVLVKGEEIAMSWQKAILRVLLNPVQIQYLSDRNGCFASPHDVYVLGRQGNDNSWPFFNRSAIPGTRAYVPAGAARFKRKFWREFGIESGDSTSGDVWGLPPLKVLYSMRKGNKGRVFGQEDEGWIRGMLRDECSRGRVEYVEVDPGAIDFEEQVKVFGEVGLVVGLHGSNLVDACFMRGFGAMVEILGNGTGSLCYINGGNCGLKRYSWESERRTECGIADGKLCRKHPRYRRVEIAGDRDREGVRGKVRDAISWIWWLRERFPEGVPVAYDEQEDGFYIDEERGKE